MIWLKINYLILIGIFSFLWLSLLAFDYNAYAWEGENNGSVSSDSSNGSDDFDNVDYSFDITEVTDGIMDKLDKLIDLAEELVELEYRKEEDNQQHLETIETQLENTYEAVSEDENKIVFSENIDDEALDQEESTENYQKSIENSSEEATTENIDNPEEAETYEITLLDIHNDLLKLLVSASSGLSIFSVVASSEEFSILF